ncbi:type IX secretion system ring subunit PorN/GldN [Adhaeribacter radiodurans]|uniref:Gliding motility protein GldN n=1 Tax=Adhaeribacter radiodurans TaxID=2745197 RepID=A0A7L7L273_9BACT|nr:gliding motility protein GldN [Adhaeribacter radiodurans]QMU26892.1 gliding motility protein GldN [Adhaeribacter radiodurans]
MNKLLILVLSVGISVSAYAQQKKATGTPTKPAQTQPALPKATGNPANTRSAATQQSAAGGSANGGANQPATTVTSGNASARPIPETDLMYKKVVWRGLDLREKQNKPMFSVNKEITKVIIEAVKRGELIPYRNDSMTTPLSNNEFSVKLTKPDESGDAMSEEEKKIFGNAPAAEEDDVFAKLNNKGKKGATAAATQTVNLNEFFPKELYQLEMKENIVFDKKRSRMYYDIQAITLVIPVKYSAKGVEERIASFKYSDLVKVFRAHPNEAIWYNEQNDAQHKNLADAFDLRLFSSYIKKVSNANDDDLATINEGSQKGLLASQKALEELIEWESSLWSY